MSDLYNLHGEAGGSAHDGELREQGMRDLAAFMNAHSAGRAILVGGDFNLHTDSEPDRTTYELLLTLANLTDSCAAVGCPDPGRIDKWAFRRSDALVDRAGVVEQRDRGLPRHERRRAERDPVAVRFAWQLGG